MDTLALISGGSRGLGAALRKRYRDAGWEVVTFSRSGHGEGHVALDLARPDEAARALAGSLAPLAAHDWDEVVAISNAAQLGPVGPLTGKGDIDILANVNINVAGGIVFMNAVLRAFAAHDCEKTLVNISSGAAQRAFHGWSLYCAAKAGLERFVECVALEQAALAHPFRAVNISPGVIDTGMQAEIRGSGDADFPDRDRFVGLKEDGVLQSPDAVAEVIARIVAERPVSGRRFEVADYSR
jgi:benzil reductase ((S)-benzoin forming)